MGKGRTLALKGRGETYRCPSCRREFTRRRLKNKRPTEHQAFAMVTTILNKITKEESMNSPEKATEIMINLIKNQDGVQKWFPR